MKESKIEQKNVRAGGFIPPATPKFFDRFLTHTHTHTHTHTQQDSGASVNVRDRDGNTPVHVAAEKSCAEVMETLLDYGSSVDAINNRVSDSMFFI